MIYITFLFEKKYGFWEKEHSFAFVFQHYVSRSRLSA